MAPANKTSCLLRTKNVMLQFTMNPHMYSWTTTKKLVRQAVTQLSPSGWTKHSPRPLFRQVLRLGMIVAWALATWNLAKFATGSVSPLVVVLSGSMKPAVDRGDILVLHNNFDANQVHVGDIVVFSIEGRNIPIVHRIIKKVRQPSPSSHVKKAGKDSTTFQHPSPIIGSPRDDDDDDWVFVTKGDANHLDDTGLYAEGQDWITRQDIQGKAIGVLRYVGFATILLNDYPAVKYALLAIMGWTTLVSGGDD